MSSYFDMDGYGGYIWPSYAVAAIVLIGLLVYTLRKARAEKSTLEKLEAEIGTRSREDEL